MGRIAGVLAGMLLVLAVGGCGGSADKDSSFDRSVRIINNGTAESPQRFLPKTGEPVDLDLTLSGVNPGERVTYGLRRQITDTGDGTFDLTTTLRSFDFPPDAAPDSQETLEQQRDELLQSSLTERIATDGMVLERDISAPTAGAEANVELVAQHLLLFMPLFPLEPIGDGALWVQQIAVPDLFGLDDRIDMLVSIDRTSERRASEPERPIDFRLRLAGPVGDARLNLPSNEFPQARIRNVTGAGAVTVDPVRGIGTGTVTYEATVEQIQLNRNLTRKALGVPGPVRVTLTAR